MIADLACIVIQDVRQRRIPKSQVQGYEYNLEIDLQQRNQTFIVNIIDELSASVQSHDHVCLTITSRSIHHEIWLPFMMTEQLTADHVMVEIDRVVQSNDTWLLGDFYLNFIHAPLPIGGAWSRGAAGCLASYFLQKYCIIQINKDALCCTRAIIAARARLDNHPKWHNIRHRRREQLHLVRQLHIDTALSLSHVFSHTKLSFFSKVYLKGVFCSQQKGEKFQTSLRPSYQLHVISRDFFNAIVYEGPHKVKNKLYLYHADNHYSVITSMPAFVERNYYCDNCHVGYNHLGGHVCKQGCKCCQAQTACAFQKWVSCSSCRRYFVSDMCYQTHLTSGVCNVVRGCNVCGESVSHLQQTCLRHGVLQDV